MFLKATAFLMAFAAVAFIGLVLLGASSTRRGQSELQSIEGTQLTQQTQRHTATSECADLRPLFELLLTRSNQSIAEFEE